MFPLLVALIGAPLAAPSGTDGADPVTASSSYGATDLDKLATQLKTRIGDDAGLGAVVRFDMGKTGQLFLDGKSTPNTVSTQSIKADVTVVLSADQLQSWLSGKLSLGSAAKSGQLKVEGDMGVAQELYKL